MTGDIPGVLGGYDKLPPELGRGKDGIQRWTPPGEDPLNRQDKPKNGCGELIQRALRRLRSPQQG